MSGHVTRKMVAAVLVVLAANSNAVSLPPVVGGNIGTAADDGCAPSPMNAAEQ